MSSPRNFDTIAHEARGQAGNSYAESQDAGSRSLFSFTGLLIGSIAGLIKKLAFNEQSQAATEPENSALDGDTRPNLGGLITSESSERHGQSSDENGTAGAAELSRVSLGAGSRYQHALFRGDDPEALRDTQLAPPTVAAIPLLPANDNAGLRLPLSNPESAAAPPTGAAAGSRAAASPDDELGQADLDPGTETTAEKPATVANDHDQTDERNRAPVVTGPVSLGPLHVNTALVIALTDLLPHASDPDGDALAITDLVASSGTLVAGENNTWTFTPARGDVGDVTFSYAITDGEFSVTQTAELDLVETVAARQFGTDDDDVLVGTRAADDIVALGGSDIVDVMAGDDVVDGGDGDDIILGGSGDDLIFGGSGDDVIDAGDGDDIVFAGTGNDFVIGGKGADVIHGEDGDDTLNAGTGNDVAYGGDGNDLFFVTKAPGSGTTQPTQLPDTSGDASISTLEQIVSKPADIKTTLDTPSAAAIAATASTGSSAEAHATAASTTSSGEAIAKANSVTPIGDGNDVYDGGAGIDTLDLTTTSSDTVVDLASGTATSDDIGVDILKNIENVVTGSGDDTIIANAAQNKLTGGAGDDTFVFMAASDTDSNPDEIDSITDFEVGDKIDVSHMDGDEKSEGKQSFEFKGKADHFEKAAEIIYKYEKHEDGEHTIVSGNDDDDLDADFSVDLLGHHDLTHEDFHGLS